MSKDQLDEQMEREIKEDANMTVTEPVYVARKRWLLFGLPFTFTKYSIGEKILTIVT